MDSQTLEDMAGLLEPGLELFSSHGAMELDGGGLLGPLHSGLVDNDHMLSLSQQNSLGGLPGDDHNDLLAAAMRTGSLGAPAAFTPRSPSTGPELVNNAVLGGRTPPPAAAAAAAPAMPAPATHFTIRPMPARKSGAVKPAAAAATAAPPASAKAPAAAAKQAAKAAKQQQQQLIKQEQQQQDDDDNDDDEQLDACESDTEPASGRGGSGAGGGKRRKRTRNAKQQELNRRAQQRYRERRKQKYSTLQETVDALSGRLGSLSTLEAANTELQQRNGQLEAVVQDQQAQLEVQKDTIARQAQQLQGQAVQLTHQAKQLQAQVQVIQQQDRTISELHSRLGSSSTPAAATTTNDAPAAAAAAAAAPGAEQLNERQIALAVHAVLTGVAASLPPKDAGMQQLVAQLPDALLQQIRSCCREVALHLKKSELKDTPHAISVPCC